MTTEKDLVTKEISNEAKLDIKLVDGKLKLIVSYDGKGVDAGMYVDFEPAYFIDKLTAAIPGEIDNEIAKYLKIALKIA